MGKRAFEESLGTHNHLVASMLDHELELPSSYDYSPSSLDDQLINECYDNIYWHEYLFATPLHHNSHIPYVDAPLTRLLLRRLVCLVLMSLLHMCIIIQLMNPLT